MPSETEKNHLTRGQQLEETDRRTPIIGKSWFFGIGINEYQFIQNLNNAKKDILDIQTELEQRYDLEECRTLFDGEATRKNIIDHLQDLQEAVTENDKVIIYYAGHGYLDGRGRGYWLPHDAEKRSRATYLRNTQIRESIEDIDARHILLISDSCFSGTLLRDVAMDQLALAKLEKERSRWVISSGRQQEPVADGQPGTNSPFTASILKVLRDNQNPRFNAALLFDQASKLTLFKYDQMPQSAPLIRAGHDGGQYIFRLKNDEAAAFETATRRNTLPAYSHFLRRFPRGQYAEKALSRIVELEEDQVWQKAQRLDQISDYFRYLNRYPEGRYTAEADQAIERLERGITKTDVPLEKTNVDRPASQKKPGRPQEKKDEANIFTDPRDGQTYKTIELNGLRWMAQNLNYDMGEGCWYYKHNPKNGEQYGQLYTWEAAKKACPPGWRLPTDEEWRDMARIFGGVDDDASDGGKAAYQALIAGGSSGFSAQLGGNRYSSGGFGTLGDGGVYWSATEYDSGYAWVYRFYRVLGELVRGNYDKPWGFSCRCVQD